MANGNTKATIFIGAGTIFAIIGVCLFCSGGYKSVMVDPEDGPLVGDAVRLNAGHYRQLILNYPEIFNCETLDDEIWSAAAIGTPTAAYPDSVYRIADNDIRDAALAYCRFKDGEQAWTFALYLPLTIAVIIVAIVSLIRKSGYTLGLVGAGLSALMIGATLVTLVHYQNQSAVVRTLSNFSDCEDVSATVKNVIRGWGSAETVATAVTTSAFENSLYGPIPRRGWVCEEDIDYDSDLKTAAYLVYGGAAVQFVAFLFLLIGFAYVVRPIITPASAFSVKANTFATRGAALEFDDEIEYYTDDSASY